MLEKYVLSCPDATGYKHKASRKCAELPRKYDYHCMRDTDKENLIEFCAKTEVLSGNILRTICLSCSYSRV